MTEEARDLKIKIKPLSENAFLAFFQRIARWWLGEWYIFSGNRAKLAKVLYQVFFFLVFSVGVTVWQYLLMLFLPYAFGAGLAATEFIWPAIDLNMTDPETGARLVWAIFNEPMIDVTGHITEDAALSVIGGGLGNFIAFELAVFTAQCINFPLQRNITFRSKGNPWYQAAWYFIGWIIISISVNAFVGIVTPFLTSWGWAKAVRDLIKTFITGGVSMIVFFFIFSIIFPDLDKMADKAKNKVEKLRKSGASPDVIIKAEKKAEEIGKKARFENARKKLFSSNNVADAKAVSWESMVKALEKKRSKNAPVEDIKALEKNVEKAYSEALEAAAKLREARAEFDALNQTFCS